MLGVPFNTSTSGRSHSGRPKQGAGAMAALRRVRVWSEVWASAISQRSTQRLD